MTGNAYRDCSDLCDLRDGSLRSWLRYSRRVPSRQEQTLGDLVFPTEHLPPHGADSAVGTPLVFRLAVARRQRSRRARAVVRPGGRLLVAKHRACRFTTSMAWSHA